jgi:hypothetical protein
VVIVPRNPVSEASEATTLDAPEPEIEPLGSVRGLCNGAVTPTTSNSVQRQMHSKPTGDTFAGSGSGGVSANLIGT